MTENQEQQKTPSVDVRDPNIFDIHSLNSMEARFGTITRELSRTRPITSPDDEINKKKIEEICSTIQTTNRVYAGDICDAIMIWEEEKQKNQDRTNLVLLLLNNIPEIVFIEQENCRSLTNAIIQDTLTSLKSDHASQTNILIAKRLVYLLQDHRTNENIEALKTLSDNLILPKPTPNELSGNPEPTSISAVTGTTAETPSEPITDTPSMPEPTISSSSQTVNAPRPEPIIPTAGLAQKTKPMPEKNTLFLPKDRIVKAPAKSQPSTPSQPEVVSNANHEIKSSTHNPEILEFVQLPIVDLINEYCKRYPESDLRRIANFLNFEGMNNNMETFIKQHGRTFNRSGSHNSTDVVCQSIGLINDFRSSFDIINTAVSYLQISENQFSFNTPPNSFQLLNREGILEKLNKKLYNSRLSIINSEISFQIQYLASIIDGNNPALDQQNISLIVAYRIAQEYINSRLSV